MRTTKYLGFTIVLMLASSALMGQSHGKRYYYQQQNQCAACSHKRQIYGSFSCRHFDHVSKQHYVGLQNMHAAYMEEVMPIRGELKKKRGELDYLLISEAANNARMNTLIDEIATLREELLELRIEHLQEVREYLPESARVYFDDQLLQGASCRHKYHERYRRRYYYEDKK